MGFRLGLDRRWRQLLPVSAIGTAVLVSWYIEMFAADQSDPSTDNEAAKLVRLRRGWDSHEQV